MFKKRLMILLGIASTILLIPLIAMRFTSEVNWDFKDFLVGAVLLYGTAFILELILHRLKTSQYRFLWVMGVVLCLMVVWMELAVGILD